MLKIGLTGGIGSGKTTVANLFEHHNVPIIDADEIAQTLTQPNSECYTKIVQHFGQKYVRTDGSLNRALIREIIFADKTKKAWLEQLLHPKIIETLTNKMIELNTPYCIAVVPLLVETKLEKLFDRILVVNTDEEKQLERTIARDHSNENKIKEIIQTQSSAEERLKAATDIINNNNDLVNLTQQVNKLHELYAKLSQSH